MRQRHGRCPKLGGIGDGKYTHSSAGTAPSKVVPFALALIAVPVFNEVKPPFSAGAVFRSVARPMRPALPFLPTPP
jgi:hypothetical protein